MFVFTDAEPKDGSDFNVRNVIDMAMGYYETKITFFLHKNMCGSKSNIEKFTKVAIETGGN